MTHPKPSRRLSSILRKYGLHTYESHACPTLYKKRAAYRMLTDKGSFLLKPYKGEQRLLNQICSRLAWLKKHSFDSMPQWLKSGNGKHWITKTGRLYYVTEWIDGTPLGEDVQDYERLGEVLARLHLISRRRSSVHPSYSMMEISRFRRRHRTFARQLRAMKKKKNGIDSWFIEQGDQCLSLAEEAWNTLKQRDVMRILMKEKPSIIHGDVTSPNVIVHADGIYLVDWERARRGSAYYEVAKTLNNVAAFSVPYMKALLGGYEKHYPLMPEERLIIASLCRLPREAWMAANQIQSGVHTDMFNVLKETWPKRMEAIRWMDGWARQQPQATVNEMPSIPEASHVDLLRDLLERGRRELADRMFDEARVLFQDAVVLNPNSAEAHAWLAAAYGRLIEEGIMLEKMKLLPFLENAIATALEIDPTHPFARRINGARLLNTPETLGGDPAAASKEFLYCIKQGMEEADIWVSLCECYIKMEDSRKALDVLKVALVHEPEHERAKELLQHLSKMQNAQ